MEHAKGCACLSEEWRSEIRQTGRGMHRGMHVCKRSDQVKYGRLIGRGMQRDVHVCQRSDKVKYGRPIKWGLQRGAHVCPRSNMQRMVRIILIYNWWIISLLICICYHLSGCKTNNWKTLSSSFTCRAQPQVDNTAAKHKKVTAKLAKNFGGKTNHWKTCQGPCNCNLVSQHDMIYFGACIDAVKYHLSLRALCMKRNSPLLICSIS